ncbi:hypothetical protein BRC91_00805 [Halobacteriales archaeon QS_4_62_28]|nr:MAG: hypothetical protein BRC91_00805 [Halobacteriales archaeon QS_4_62_28]
MGTQGTHRAGTRDTPLDRERRAGRRLAQRFQDRLANVAATTENRTGREMSVQSASAELTSEASTGIVELSAQWHGLGATTDDR